MQWSVPSFPTEVLDEPGVTVVQDAFLTPFEYGRLRTFGRPYAFMRGAVHDAEGRLVVASQKIGGTNGHPRVPADPAQVTPDPEAGRLEGRWLYGGHWIPHFGHFIAETVTTLWPTGQDVDGLVFHKYLRRPTPKDPWMLRLLELAGFGGLPIKIVGGQRGRRVDELVVPTRSIVANGWGHPQAREVWERIAAPFASDGPGLRRIYLTRTAFNRSQRDHGHRRARSDLAFDEGLDRVFATAGFEVVAPEQLPLDDQLRLVAGAAVLAGCSGSALHLSAFAPRSTRVVEIGDERTPRRPVGLQLVIDRLSDHPHAFIPRDLPFADMTDLIRRIDD